MSVALHLERLQVYDAAAIQVGSFREDPELVVLPGGGLEERYAQRGRAPILEVFRDPIITEVMLADGPLEIHAKRQGERLRFTVLRQHRTIYDSLIDIPPAPLTEGLLFKADPTSWEREIDVAVQDIAKPLFVVRDASGHTVAYSRGAMGPGLGAMSLQGFVPATKPENLGDPSFYKDHGSKWAALVQIAPPKAPTDLQAWHDLGVLPSIQSDDLTEARLVALRPQLAASGPWGLHWSANASISDRLLELAHDLGADHVYSSAPPFVTSGWLRFRYRGARVSPDGTVQLLHRWIVEGVEPERRGLFSRPPTPDLLRDVVERGWLTAEEVSIAESVPFASDIVDSHAWGTSRTGRRVADPSSVWSAYSEGACFVVLDASATTTQRVAEAFHAACIEARKAVARAQGLSPLFRPG